MSKKKSTRAEMIKALVDLCDHWPLEDLLSYSKEKMTTAYSRCQTKTIKKEYNLFFNWVAVPPEEEV